MTEPASNPTDASADARPAPAYAELCAMSNFTFLRGASHPEELVVRAAELGLVALAIADRNSLAGVVRAHVALRELKRAQVEGGMVRVRGHVRVDASSRQQIDPGRGLAAVGALPRLIVGTRLVLADSPVVILDEPTTGLDAATARDLAATLDGWLGERTTVMITHDPSLLPRHDRVVRLGA
mgnify:CR=1 FL=1